MSQLVFEIWSKCQITNEEDSKELARKINSDKWKVINVEEKPSIRKPVPPFTTSTLQQEANRKLRLSARETMRCAQGLYERGFYYIYENRFCSSV